jgi:predicted nuclease of predicted toxin-antitoxin system
MEAILITNDKGFGNIFNYPPQSYKGIIVLKISPQNQQQVHNLLLQFLKTKNQDSLKGNLVVIDSHHFRVRK